MVKKITVRDDKKKWDNLKKELMYFSSRGGFVVEVGVMGTDGSDLVKYATKNEFGSKKEKIPERSFLRGMIDNNKQKIKFFIKKQTKKSINSAKDGSTNVGDRLFKLIGLFAETLVKKRIKNSKSWAVPNSPLTIALKSAKHGGIKDQPLVDTGRMVNSIRYRISKRKKKM